MTDDCPFCDAGIPQKKVLYVDFSRINLRTMPAWVEAAKKADKVVYMNLEMAPKEADKFIAAVSQKPVDAEVKQSGTNRHERRKRKALDRGV